MYKNSFYIILFIFLSASGIKAQIPVFKGIAVNVTATVVSDSPVELTTLMNMMVAGTPDDNNQIYISPITNNNAGLMKAKGRPGSQARMTYMMFEVMNEETGAGSLSLKYEMSGNPERNQRASTLIQTGEAVLNFGNDGLYYLWVGGTVDVSKAAPGKYGGQFTIEIEYL